MWILKVPTFESVAEHWKKRYYNPYAGIWDYAKNLSGGADKVSEIYHAIIDNHMKGATNLDIVDKIIGNKSWTTNHCNSCIQDKREPMICFDVNGGEYEYTICWNCINEARHKIEKEQRYNDVKNSNNSDTD